MAPKRKQTFIVLKYPYRHPNEPELVPVGAEVDLSHLTHEEIMVKMNRGQVIPVGEYIPPEPEPEPEPPPKLNKYGLPYGQRKKEMNAAKKESKAEPKEK